jgi:uncharacterized RDD family membrane protein YckC
MTRGVFGSIRCLIILCLLAYAGVASADTRQLLVHGSADRYWIVRIEQDPATADGNQAGAAPALRSTVLSRRSSVSPWKQIARLSVPIVSVTHRGSQLGVLMDNGQWMLVWDGGNVMGALPQDGAKLIELTSDGEHLWAVGVTGIGPSPSTAGATQPGATLPARTRMLYRLDQHGEWEGQAPLPAELQDGDLSLDLNRNGLLIAAARPGGVVHTSMFDPVTRTFVSAGSLNVGEAVVVQLLPDLGRPILFAGDADGRGVMYPRGERWGDPIRLDLPADAPKGAANGIGVAMNSIRLNFVNARNGITEYAFSHKGEARDKPIDLPTPIKPPESDMGWLSALAAALLTVVVINSLRRRDAMTSEEIEDAGLRIAPHGQRLLAAFIDGLPVILTVGYLSANYEMDEVIDSKQLQFYLAVAAYLIHTLVFELIFGWSIGKKMADLRVVMADGAKPTPKALLIRNLLRIVDLVLPLAMLLVLISPLHQRVGDMAAETIVVTSQRPREPAANPEEEA